MPKKILRNLTTTEILAQIMVAKESLGDFEHDDVYANRRVTHLVFMGMGEPLYNYHNLRQAIEILRENDGLRLSKRRMTVSTAGVVPGILNMVRDNLDVNLAVSLHAPNDALRSQLMDVNKLFPIKDLMEACVAFGSRPAKRITFEYVMLNGVNDRFEDAEELYQLLHENKIHSFVNLIPFNPWPGSSFSTSSNNRVHAFHRVLDEKNDPMVRCAVRWPKGRDIGAACGQLATSLQS
uniref:Radical SAM core domain-containing protein n=1 Tax=Lotharella oceanica TaxID=641309 RepID=A0A7S2TSY3_9EUKA